MQTHKIPSNMHRFTPTISICSMPKLKYTAPPPARVSAPDGSGTADNFHITRSRPPKHASLGVQNSGWSQTPQNTHCYGLLQRKPSAEGRSIDPEPSPIRTDSYRSATNLFRIRDRFSQDNLDVPPESDSSKNKKCLFNHHAFLLPIAIDCRVPRESSGGELVLRTRRQALAVSSLAVTRRKNPCHGI